MVIPYEFNAERFSRWMAYVLRHNPSRYGLEPDRHGFVDLEAFMAIAKQRYQDVSLEQLETLLKAGPRNRFEIASGRLRARYGHSIPVEPAGDPIEPPKWLYHGTEAMRVAGVRQDGLRSMERRLVHLSATLEDAIGVARRRTENPVIMKIAAKEAHEQGLHFFLEGSVYLASYIPAKYLSVENLPTTSAEL